MTRDLFDIDGLAEVAAQHAWLAKKGIRRAVFSSLDAVSLTTQTEMVDAFHGGIDGGPTPFSEVRPGQRKSSVLVGNAKRAGDGVASSVYVKAKQSIYLQYPLGEMPVTREGPDLLVS